MGGEKLFCKRCNDWVAKCVYRGVTGILRPNEWTSPGRFEPIPTRASGGSRPSEAPSWPGRPSSALSSRGAASRGSAVRGGAGSSRQAQPVRRDAAKAQETFAAGDRVSHKTFGPGVVRSVSGDTIEVYFSRTGKTKKLMKGFAPIVKIQ